MSNETKSNPFNEFMEAVFPRHLEMAAEMVRTGRVGPWTTEHGEDHRGFNLLFLGLDAFYDEFDRDILLALLYGGMDVDIRYGDSGETPMTYAVRHSLALTEFLLMHGADPQQRRPDGSNLIQAASEIVLPTCPIAEIIAIVETLHHRGVRICRPWFERWRTNEIPLASAWFNEGCMDTILVPALETTLEAAVDESLPDDGVKTRTCHFGTTPTPPEPPGPVGPFPEPPGTRS